MGKGGLAYTWAMKTLIGLLRSLGAHSLIGTAAVMLLITGLVFFVQSARWVQQPPPVNALMSIVLALLAIIPLTRRPLLITVGLVLAAAELFAINVLDFTLVLNLSSIASIMAVFSAAAYGGRRRSLSCLVSIVVFNGGLIYGLTHAGNMAFLSLATLLNVGGLLWSLVTFAATWRFGNALRFSRQQNILPPGSAIHLRKSSSS